MSAVLDWFCSVSCCFFFFQNSWILQRGGAATDQDPILALALLISSGTTIDFVLHFVMAAAACTPANPNMHVSGSQRYIVAMKSAGVGIFASYVTTLVGIIPMGFARLSSIRSLFVAYVISLNVGLFFGLVFIPLVSIYVYGVDFAPRGATKKTTKADEHEVKGSGARLVGKGAQKEAATNM